jgi:hypothetical protein
MWCGRKRKVDLSLSTWTGAKGFDPKESLKTTVPPEDEDYYLALPDGLAPTSFVKHLRATGLTAAQAALEAAVVAAGEMADTVKIFSRMVQTRIATLIRNVGGGCPNLVPSVGTAQPDFRCECCEEKVSAVWAVPPMRKKKDGDVANTARYNILRKLRRKVCDREFFTMDLLCKPMATMPLQRTSSGRRTSLTEKGAAQASSSTMAKATHSYGKTLRNLNVELETRGLARASTKETAKKKLIEDDEEQVLMATYRPPAEIKALHKWCGAKTEMHVCVVCAGPVLMALREKATTRTTTTVEEGTWLEVCAMAQGKEALYNGTKISYGSVSPSKSKSKKKCASETSAHVPSKPLHAPEHGKMMGKGILWKDEEEGCEHEGTVPPKGVRGKNNESR